MCVTAVWSVGTVENGSQSKLTAENSKTARFARRVSDNLA